MRMNIRSFIPPIFFLIQSKKPMKKYESYEDALNDSHTYEDSDVIEVVESKTDAYRNAVLAGDGRVVSSRQTAQNMFVLSCVCHVRPLDVLEIGGACGINYFELNHLCPGRIKSWRIVETTTMAAAGRRLIRDGRLTFYDALDTAVAQLENLDLLIAQGVLQYMPDPLQTLETLLNLGFDWVYITRTFVGNGIEYPIITKQVVNLSTHGPGGIPKGFADRKTSQPLTFVPFESIASLISVGYSVAYQFAEGGDRSMRIGSQTVRTREMGFLLKKNSQLVEHLE